MYFLSKTLNFRGENDDIVEKVKNVKKGMLDDVTGTQQRHLHMYPIILTSACRRHNTLSIKGKIFSKYRKVTKTLAGVGFQPPPSPHRELVCTSKG